MLMPSPPPFPRRPAVAASIPCKDSEPQEDLRDVPEPQAADSDITSRKTSPLAQLGRPPAELELPEEFQQMPQRRTLASEPLLGRRSRSLQPQRSRPSPPLRWEEESMPQEASASSSVAPSVRLPPVVMHNIATFQRPEEYVAAIRGRSSTVGANRRLGSMMSDASSQQLVPTRDHSGRRKLRAPTDAIDEAIQREMIGDGVALSDAVATRRGVGWAVRQRHVQRSDVGHCCHGCRQPLRELNEEVTVWTGAAIYRRFHPACAASYMLRVDAGVGARSGECSTQSSVVDGYADGWRAPRENSGRGPAVVAARRWLLSQDPGAWNSLRGDLFTTVTVTVDGEKKAVPGLSHDQLKLLQARHCWHGSCEDLSSAAVEECAICFGEPDPENQPCVRLPCAAQHVFHVACVMPWLRKASLCPTCRRDLRPLLPPERSTARERRSSAAAAK